MSATDDLRAYAKESLSPGRALERKMVTARQMDALRAERDEAIAERDAARDRERGTLTDFCAHLERHHGLRVPASWSALVNAFLAEYLTEGGNDGR